MTLPWAVLRHNLLQRSEWDRVTARHMRSLPVALLSAVIIMEHLFLKKKFGLVMVKSKKVVKKVVFWRSDLHC